VLQIEYTAQFKRDLKRSKRRGKTMDKLVDVMNKIVHQTPLSSTLKDHALRGNYAGYRECHVEPDWLLIYKVILDESVVIFTRTGSHADLFE